MDYGAGAGAGAGVRELLIITNFGRILREHPDSWMYDNKDLGKIMKPGELVVSAIMSEKHEVKE